MYNKITYRDVGIIVDQVLQVIEAVVYGGLFHQEDVQIYFHGDGFIIQFGPGRSEAVVYPLIATSGLSFVSWTHAAIEGLDHRLGEVIELPIESVE